MERDREKPWSRPPLAASRAEPGKPSDAAVGRRLAVGTTAAAILGVAVLAGWYSWRLRWADGGQEVPARIAARGERVPLAGKAREHPVVLQPVGGLADTVTERQLIKALCAALPMWHPPTVPSLIHELRLWGQNADFTKGMVGQARSGKLMVETLLSDKLCRERTTPNGDSFLLDSPFGINVVLSGTMDAKENRAEGHFGQLLMILGEAGVPLSMPVTTDSGRVGTVADILQDAKMRFGWTKELEFIGCAMAYWVPPETVWTDRFGNRCSFDELIERLTAIPYGDGACGGCHVPYTIATILGVDRQYLLLSESARRQAVQRLKELSTHLEATQRPEGGWDATWVGVGRTTKPLYSDAVLDRLTVTGHHLEWIAMAPETCRPSARTVARAVTAFVRDTDEQPPLRIRSFKSILPCSHGARALCLLHGSDAYAVWKSWWDAGRLILSSRGGYELREARGAERAVVRGRGLPGKEEELLTARSEPGEASRGQSGGDGKSE